MDKTSFLKRVGQGDNVLLTGPAGTGTGRAGSRTVGPDDDRR